MQFKLLLSSKYFDCVQNKEDSSANKFVFYFTALCLNRCIVCSKRKSSNAKNKLNWFRALTQFYTEADVFVDHGSFYNST